MFITLALIAINSNAVLAQAPTEKTPDFKRLQPCFEKSYSTIAAKIGHKGEVIKVDFDGNHPKSEGKGFEANSNIGKFYVYEIVNDYLVVPPDKYTAPAFFIKLGADGKGCTIQ